MEGIPIFRASSTIRERIDALLAKPKQIQINAEEEKELDLYEDIDDRLSLVNRPVRNIYLNQNESDL